MADITYVPESNKLNTMTIDYIFEPELEEIFWFFDTQVRYILFGQVMLEVKLSRIATRLTRMNIGEQKALKAIKKTTREIKKEIALQNNIRLLETFSGISLWKKSKT